LNLNDSIGDGSIDRKNHEEDKKLRIEHKK